jgi:hypothetical protein
LGISVNKKALVLAKSYSDDANSFYLINMNFLTFLRMSMSMTGDDGTMCGRMSGFELPFSCAGDVNVGVDGGVLILTR